ncbi:MAG: aquaporin [Cytophagaceae bacterium]|nr:aquaporin [Cytophagaceae bacterium]|tara:strand:+ start:3194 stop:3931 length:738 start_codon:yes stop_codon:yes gene_type:complete
MSPFIAEVLGTFILIMIGNGVVANVLLEKTKGQDSGWIVITTAWGLAVYVGVLIAGPYSGAHLNPAVTLSLAIAGLFEWGNVPIYITAQMLGAMLGAFVVWLMHKKHYDITESPELKEATFCTSPAINHSFSNFFAEFMGTFVLIIAVLYIAEPQLQFESGEQVAFGLGSLGALPVALVVWAIGLGLGGTTGYAINPARDLGPRIVHALLPLKGKTNSNWAYAWVPIVAPIAGGGAAAFLYMLFA